MLQKTLLVCGFLSSLLYVAMNIFIPMQWKEYSSTTQTVSELSAIGAPTKSVWVMWSIVYTLLFIAFGFGVFMSSRKNHSLRVAGRLIIVYGIISIAWPFAPMQLRGNEFALTDAMHIALGIVTVILMMLIMGFGAGAFKKAFRIYSIISIIFFVVFGALTGTEAPRIADNLSTPWIGVWERINIGVFLLWVIIFDVHIIRSRIK